MSKQEIIDIIELSWLASCEANMAGQGPMGVGHDVMGNAVINATRLNTYYHVLGSLLPKVLANTVTIDRPKEPWESDDN